MSYYIIYKLIDRETNLYEKSQLAFSYDNNDLAIKVINNPYKEFEIADRYINK